MGKKKSKAHLKSNCCNADLKVGGMGDFEGDKSAITMYYVCSKCNNACEYHVTERRVWTRNPKTQIIGDKREKKKRLFTDKELKEIHQNEDF